MPRVFEAVFKCTLDMITKNFEDYPEHRSNLFNLLRAINHHCFPALLTDQGNFTLIIESIKWAFKHTERNVAETGLNTLLELLNNVQASQVSNDFYRAYYLGLLQDVFSVLTDTLHKPGFKLHSQSTQIAKPTLRVVGLPHTRVCPPPVSSSSSSRFTQCRPSSPAVAIVQSWPRCSLPSSLT